MNTTELTYFLDGYLSDKTELSAVQIELIKLKIKDALNNQWPNSFQLPLIEGTC